MQKKSFIIISTLLCMTLCCCSNNKKSNESSKPAVIDYQEKDVNIIRSMNKPAGADKATPVVDKAIKLRFYNDMPNVPYIEPSAYFAEFFNTTVTKTVENNTARFASRGGFIAFDPDADVFTGYGITGFNSHPDFKSNSVQYFLKYSGGDATTPSIHTVSLVNYGIDIKGDKDETYVPLSFLSKVSGGLSYYNAQYNGKDIYVIDGNGLIDNVEKSTKYFADSYYEVLDNYQTARPSDLAEYNYNELCFVFDNLRGYTSQLVFGDNNLVSLGLNGLLERYFPKIKEYLLSQDKEKYYEGIYALFCGLDDGGHTGILSSSSVFAEAATKAASVEDFKDLVAEHVNNNNISRAEKEVFQAAKMQKFGITEEQYKANPNYYRFDDATKTAYVGFDSFDVDYNGWNNYYSGKGEVPVNTDTYAFIRSTFYKAKEDGATNYVLDMTSNGGGSTAALNGIVGLFNKATANHEENDTFSKYRSVDQYSIDVNLDGRYNQDDAKELEQFDFNIGILTSHYAFSCGNLLPSVLKELGYKIIGERTGGGSCAIIVESTADGVPYVHSSYLCLSDASGNNIDVGVAADFEIERIKIEGEEFKFDASNFYDIPTIANYLSTAYKEAE